MRKNHRAEFNYVTPIAIALLAVGIWAATQFIPAFYQKAQFSTDLSGILVANRRTPNEVVVEKILQHFQASADIEVTAADVIYTRKDESPNLVSASVNYRRLIHIPFRQEAYRLPLSVDSNQDFTVMNSIN